MRKIVSLCLLLFLVSCQSVQVNDSSHITEEEVVRVLQENGVKLVGAESSRENIFGSKLKDVNPGAYKLSEKQLFIYEFATVNDREKGTKEFAEKTATMNLVSFSMFKKRNILIFYLHGQNLNSESIPFEKEIKGALDSISEG
ncbi:hypothetical protein [Lysinibacillus sp. BPa_S21]|uniref:hypothetical protein n=1 Tax=Lysinibacillus sp. BPa_S21 TaxID=2932478 RepID=UPI002012B8CA|nr:hypothetical protein [Lysinibacillus sp. BPa_S21]MCL1696726.1 hypothetical protein [Lysinibacillus sp. BPa_S21]